MRWSHWSNSTSWRARRPAGKSGFLAETDARREGAADGHRFLHILAGDDQIALGVERCGHIGVAGDIGVDGADQVGDGVGPGRGIGGRVGAVADADDAARRNSQACQGGAGGQRHRAGSGRRRRTGRRVRRRRTGARELVELCLVGSDLFIDAGLCLLGGDLRQARGLRGDRGAHIREQRRLVRLLLVHARWSCRYWSRS